MHRRVFVLALVATACTPAKSTDQESRAAPSPRRAAPGRALLAIAEWSTPEPATHFSWAPRPQMSAVVSALDDIIETFRSR